MIYGQRGSGKTTKSQSLVADKVRLLVYDTLGHDYANGLVSSDRATFETIWKRTYAGRFRLVYRPRDPQGEFADICRMVYACGRMTFVVEETDLFFTGAKCDPAFTDVIVRGRHEQIELLAVTQCPTGFGPLLRSQAHEWFVFRTREPQHVDYLKKRCAGVDPQHIIGLAQYEYIHYVDGVDGYDVCRDDLAGNTETRHVETSAGQPVGEHADAG
ncbi:MAG: hypothetical protein A2V70_19155 [Planctomycetes bacterium RBG_13_63_9]|nr:MAG: hypothetical protein A2V70_19155 [Planctomycetes bacterium RBG_13_63_9]